MTFLHKTKKHKHRRQTYTNHTLPIKFKLCFTFGKPQADLQLKKEGSRSQSIH